MEYKIVTNPVPQNVELLVTRLLQDGWTLYGPLAVCSTTVGDDVEMTYAQALTKTS